MSDELNQLRAQVVVHLDADKVSVEKKLKQEILQLRNHARVVEDKPGHFVCEGPHGRGVVDAKNATLFSPVTQRPLRWQTFKSHLYAVHSVLCWAVLGISIE
jgi:hypothetical protein